MIINLPDYMTLIIGALYCVAAVMTGVQQTLLGPKSINYPRGGLCARIVLFWLMVALLLHGSNMIIGYTQGIYPRFAPTSFFVAIMLAATSSFMVADLLQRRLSAKSWARIEHMIGLVNCRNTLFKVLGYSYDKDSKLDG